MNGGTSNSVTDMKGRDASWCIQASKGSKSRSVSSTFDFSVGTSFPGTSLAANPGAIKHVLSMYSTLLMDKCTGNEYQDEAGQSTCKTCPDGQVGAPPYKGTESTTYDQ